jgi:hypothetical protein
VFGVVFLAGLGIDSLSLRCVSAGEHVGNLVRKLAAAGTKDTSLVLVFGLCMVVIPSNESQQLISEIAQYYGELCHFFLHIYNTRHYACV